MAFGVSLEPATADCCPSENGLCQETPTAGGNIAPHQKRGAASDCAASVSDLTLMSPIPTTLATLMRLHRTLSTLKGTPTTNQSPRVSWKYTDGCVPLDARSTTQGEIRN